MSTICAALPLPCDHARGAAASPPLDHFDFSHIDTPQQAALLPALNKTTMFTLMTPFSNALVDNQAIVSAST